MTRVYLYQTVHLRRGRPRLVAAHAAVLAEAARALFGLEYAPDPELLERRIAEAARAERYPSAVSGFVRIELTAGGEERIVPAGVSLYDGYALRSLMPDASVVQYDLPFGEAPTSVREAAAELARYRAAQAGAGVALRCDAAGVCRTLDDAPLLAVAGRRVVLAPGERSVERHLALLAVRAAGLDVSEEPFGCGALADFDELFAVDHRGVTAVSRCGGRPYMALLAERVARALESLFSE